MRLKLLSKFYRLMAYLTSLVFLQTFEINDHRQQPEMWRTLEEFLVSISTCAIAQLGRLYLLNQPRRQ